MNDSFNMPVLELRAGVIPYKTEAWGAYPNYSYCPVPSGGKSIYSRIYRLQMPVSVTYRYLYLLLTDARIYRLQMPVSATCRYGVPQVPSGTNRTYDWQTD